MRRFFIGIIATLLLCTGIPGCSSTPSTSPVSLVNLDFAADYTTIYNKLSEFQYNNYFPSTASRDLIMLSAEGAMSPPAPMVTVPAPTFAIATNGIADDYSKTNVQVEGIDEGDIVKTDGRYIYSLRDGMLSIYKADGANTYLVSTTKLLSTTEELKIYTDFGIPYGNEYASELFLYENYVVVITQYSQYLSYGYWQTWENVRNCNVYIYDVSDPTTPELVHKLGQDGDVIASRLIGNTLYLISTYSVYNFSEDDPETYIPALYVDGVRALIAPSCIAIMPYVNYSSYTIVSAIDIQSGTIAANQTLLGGGSTIYMSWQNLYITDGSYKTEENTRNDGNFTVVEYTNYSSTNITRIDISSGSVVVAAYGSVPGSLGDQFHLDEYQGYLRVVTTNDSYTHYTIEDRVREVIGYSGGESKSSNGLYVLDMSLTQVGAVDSLAPGERVYSVRFDGDIGYFVTFRTVDPLFAVDLSDPHNPTVLSALKIPGFSQYLHVYSDGLLFGLGYNADELTGRRGTMKLSMFDTSDPADVTEAHTLSISTNYSTALYNHKAIVVDSGKNIIGFPTESGYVIYGYDDQTGFFRRASITLLDNWWSDSRGLYIAEYFYIVHNNGIAVIDMDSFQLITTVYANSNR